MSLMLGRDLESSCHHGWRRWRWPRLWKRDAPSAVLGERGVPALFAQRWLGELLHVGVAHIMERLSSLHGETAVQDGACRVVTVYHGVVFKPPFGNRLRSGFNQEMKTLAVALVSLLEGSLVCTTYLPLARYKALLETVQSGLWDVAAEPVQEGGLTAEAEMLRATQTQACKLMLRQAFASFRGARPGIG